MDESLIRARHYQSMVQPKGPNAKIVYRTHRNPEPRNDVDIHAAYWSLGIFDFPVNAGFLKCGSEMLPLEGRKIIFIPPFSILHWQVLPSLVSWVYLIVNETLSECPLDKPILFSENKFAVDVETLSKIPNKEILKKIEVNQENGTPIALSGHSCSWQAKVQIDAAFRESSNIQALVGGVHASFSYLSRQFKKDFGVSPVRYRQSLRMMQASVDMLFRPQSVEATQLEVGIEDSSYFYQSFRNHLQAHPSEFRKVVKQI